MDNTIERFGKKVDNLVLYILVPCFLVSVIPMFFGSDAFWILFVINFFSWGLVYWLYVSTDTTIQDDLLVHTTGPITWEIAISDIQTIRLKSKSGINHGTWSLDKMDVIYVENYKKTLSIAPLLKDQLIERLKELNSEIKVI